MRGESSLPEHLILPFKGDISQESSEGSWKPLLCILSYEKTRCRGVSTNPEDGVSEWATCVEEEKMDEDNSLHRPTGCLRITW